jgi:thiol:disulfide interchange protein
LLGSALTPVAIDGGVLRGGVVLALFGLGAAIPLVAVTYASRRGFARARDRVLARIERVRHAFALLLGAMGVAILTGADKWVESALVGVVARCLGQADGGHLTMRPRMRPASLSEHDGRSPRCAG